MNEDEIKAWGETARKITGARRVVSLDYQVPFLKITLSFMRYEYEVDVTEIIDLSAGETIIHDKIMDMSRHAEALLQRKRNGGK